jgi:hypothetical protein
MISSLRTVSGKTGCGFMIYRWMTAGGEWKEILRKIRLESHISGGIYYRKL